MTSAVRSPRGRRGVTATVVALIGLAACVFAAVEAIWIAVHHRTFWYDSGSVGDYGSRTHLSSTVVLVVGIVAAAVGLLLLLRAIVPSRRHLVELADISPLVATGVSRRGVRRAVTARVLGVDGIAKATTRVRRHHVSVSATTALREVEGLQERALAAATDTLEYLNPVRPYRTTVTLHRKDR